MKTFINYLNENINPNNMSEEEQIKFVQKDWLNIKDINNPSEEVQLAAIKNDLSSLQYIDNPTEKVQLIAVKSDWALIDQINNPSEEVKKYVAKHIDFCFFYEEASSMMEDESMSFDLMDDIMEKIKDQFDLQNNFNLIKEYPFLIQYIENPTNKIKQYVIDNLDFDELSTINIYFLNKFQEKIKDVVTKEIYYSSPKDFPWIPEIKERFKDIDRFKRFNL